MSTTPLTIQQFGAEVKKKYPAYASKSDEEVGNAMLAKYPQYKSRIKQPSLLDRYEKAVEPYTRIESPGSDKWNPSEAGKAVGNIGAGGLGVILHPLNTLESIGGMVTAPVEMMAGTPFSKTVPGQMWESLRTNPYGTVESGIGAAGAAGALSEGAEPVARAVEGVKGTAGDVLRSATGTGPRVTRGLVKETQEANAAEAAKTAEKNAAEVEKAKQANAEQQAKRAAKVQEHGQKVIEAEKQRVARQDSADRKVALERGVEHLDPEIKGQLEATEDRVNKEANRRYNELNASLNPLEADPEQMRGIIADAAEKITGSETTPTILKDLEKRLERGDQFTYEDLQGYRAELGRELRKGTLPGDVFHSYKGLQEAISDQMDSIAKNEDAKVAQETGKTLPKEQTFAGRLEAARNYYRQYAEAFIDRTSPIRKALDSTERGQTIKAFSGKDQSGVETLAKFDPDLARRINTVRGYASEAKGIRPSAAQPKPVSPLGPKPEPIQPKVTQPEVKTIGPEEVRAAKEKSLEHRIGKIRSRGQWIATGAAGYRALSSILHGNLGAVPADLLEGGIAMGGVEAISRLLEKPQVVEMLTHPRPADIAQIPPELKGDFQQIAQVAARKGIKVDPRLYAVAAAAPRKNAGDILRQAQ